MSLSRRTILKASAFACAVPLVHAQQFPSRPVRIIVAASPSTSLDLTARFLVEPLGQRLNTPVLVENKVGANGIIGTDFVAKSPPDGHTLLITAIPIYTNRWVSETPLPYDPIKDFTPIAKLSNAGIVLLVPASSPYRTLMDLVGDMRARPGEVAYSTAGAGSTTHLAIVVLNEMTRTTARHIPYKGAAAAVTDTVSGQVAFSMQSPSSALQLVKGGRLRALAVSGNRRLEGLPDVPTVAEAGVPGYDLTSFIGIMGPAGMPAPIVQKLSDELLQIGNTPAYREFCIAQSLTVDLADARAFAAEGPKELERWRRVIEASKKG